MGAPREMRRRRCIRRERTRRNATTNDDEKTTLVPRRRPTDPPRPRAAPRAPLPSRKSTSHSTRKKNQKSVARSSSRRVFYGWERGQTGQHTAGSGRSDRVGQGESDRRRAHRVRTPAPWIEHGILSLRRRAPVSNDARRSKASHSFTSARVGTRLTRYHCAIQAREARTRPSSS